MRTENTIDFIEIHQQDIVDILKSLKLNKAVGLDNISHHILRKTAETISLPLLKLFQMCLQQSIFPSLWKKARVMPLFKKDDKHVPSNYRPIALLSTVGKVLRDFFIKDYTTICLIIIYCINCNQASYQIIVLYISYWKSIIMFA